MRRSLNTETYYVNKWTNSPVKVFCSSYLLNIVFPSRSRSVSLELRNALRDFFSYFNSFRKMLGDFNQFSSVARDLYLKYSKLCFLPTDGRCDLSYSWHELAKRMFDCLDVIGRFSDRVFDVDLINELDRKRHFFISKLFSTRPDIDLSLKSYVVRKKFNRSLATQIL